MSDYLTFQEASEFLNTPRSTLYRWVRSGTVPGHKLGRQWRFLRSELEAFRESGSSGAAEALEPLAEVLMRRNSTQPDEENMQEWRNPAELAERLIWDAADEGAGWVHISPDGTGHEVRYRKEGGLDELVKLESGGFEVLDRQWRQLSTIQRSEDSRRMVLEREADTDEPERLQVRYTSLDTAAGPRVSLRLLREDRIRTDLEAIVNGPEELETLRKWSLASHGIVVLAGGSGSGKTTTAYACLSEAAKDGDRIVFTIEDRHEFFLPQVHQVKIDMNDEQAYREAFTGVLDSDPDVLFIAATFAQRHLGVLWGTALNAAESGHLVFLQIEADSADDALERLSAAVDRPVDDLVVGVSWQKLERDEDGRQHAVYEMLPGLL